MNVDGISVDLSFASLPLYPTLLPDSLDLLSDSLLQHVSEHVRLLRLYRIDASFALGLSLFCIHSKQNTGQGCVSKDLRRNPISPESGCASHRSSLATQVLPKCHGIHGWHQHRSSPPCAGFTFTGCSFEYVQFL